MCVRPALARRLVPYALEVLDPAAAQEVEVHLLECEACYQRLVSIDKASGLLRDYLDHPDPGLPAIAWARPKAAPGPVRSRLRFALAIFAGLLAGLVAGFALWS